METTLSVPEPPTVRREHPPVCEQVAQERLPRLVASADNIDAGKRALAGLSVSGRSTIANLSTELTRHSALAKRLRLESVPLRDED